VLNKPSKEFGVVDALAPTVNKVDEEDLFSARFEKFSTVAKVELEEMEKRFTTANTNYSDAVLLFGEDPKAMGPEEFFAVWKTFVSKIVETSEKIEVEREKREKERKREEQKLKREQELVSKANAPKGGAAPEAEGGEGDGGKGGRGGDGGRGGRGARGGRGGRDGGRGGGRGGDGTNVSDLFAKVQGTKKT